MLARRFTIVCLLVAMFGMFFAHIVAEAGRQPRAWDQRTNACTTYANGHCSPTLRTLGL